MLPWIRGWGADVEVIEPTELRDEMIREAKRLAKRYGLFAAQKHNPQILRQMASSMNFSGAEMKDNFQPYLYQERITQLILEGKKVILQAPTGAGKTFAAIRPFLYSLKDERDFPRKCIYSVPMRVLAKQFVSEYQDRVAERAKQLHIEPRYPGAPYVDIQTGEQGNDPNFEATLTFATIDQVLSSFLISPYGTPRRQANINAGAVVGAYLVFDEFHLFDPESTLPTTLEMLRMLRAVTPFLLMTATFSTAMLKELAKWLDAEIVGSTPAEQAEFAALPSQCKIRRYHTVETPAGRRTGLGGAHGQDAQPGCL